MQESNSPIILLYLGFVLSVLGNIGLTVRFFLERKTSTEVNAYNQLFQLFETLQKQVKDKEVKDEKTEKDFSELGARFDALNQKVKQTRLNLMDLQQSLKEIKSFVKYHKIGDEKILQTIAEIEDKLKEIQDSLKG